MIDWVFIVICALLVPGIMIGFGWWFGGHPPKKINHLCGYRTSMSMKNRDTWVFAHQKSGEVWLRWGKWMALLSILAMAAVVILAPAQTEMVGLAVLLGQTAALLASIAPVEKALRETFDEDGYRRTAHRK